jgi:hypothetical protein
MRPEVQVLPGPPPAMTSTNAGRRVRSFVRRQCAGSRPLTWLPFLVMDVLLQGCAPARWSATRQRQRPQADHRRPVVGIAGPTLAGSSPPGDQDHHGRGYAGRHAFGPPTAPRPCRQARPPGSTVGARHAAPAGPCPPARRVGRSLATRPRAVTPSDPPARGDQPSARIGVRQGPQVQLLAEARQPLSVHPADLRLALPGVPRPWAAVLQPRRPAVPGARHRAAGGGAGPAVAGQGGGQAPHRPRSSGPGRCRLAGVAAGRRWVGATPLPGPHGDGAVLPGSAGPPSRA